MGLLVLSNKLLSSGMEANHMNTLKPHGTKLLVTPYRRLTQWDGKIILNEQQRNVLMGDDHWFWVVAVGDKVTDVAMKDRVLLVHDHDGLEYLTDGTMRAFINLDQVLMVMPHEGFQDATTTSLAAAP
jgi:NADPH:quinone reductase-like Zn-dependent oxidoreductase